MTKHIRKLGFTLIELLVVIAIIALLLSIIIPAIGRAKVYAQKVMCSSNLRQQCLGTTLYSNENDSYVPTCGLGPWLWDISFFATNQLSYYAGFSDNKIFFCPANRIKKSTDARFWQFSWLGSTGGPYPNEVPLRDESVLTIAQQKYYYRVPPTLYMFDKYNSSTGASILDRYLVTGEEANWIRKLSNVKASGSKTMLMDVVISQNNNWKFFGIDGGGIVGLSGGTLTDDSNHKSRQMIVVSPTAQGPKPEGGNVGYADGHVDWRRFEDMKHRYTRGMWFWW